MSRAALGSTALMVLIGLLLIAVAAGFTADVFVQNAHKVSVDGLGHTFSVRPGWLVVAGFVTFAVFFVGARLVARGVGAARRRKSVLRNAEKAARERDQLAQQLAVERRNTGEGVTVIDRSADVAKPIERGEDQAGAVPSSVD
jgi:hypothetical protein